MLSVTIKDEMGYRLKYNAQVLAQNSTKTITARIYASACLNVYNIYKRGHYK